MRSGKNKWLTIFYNILLFLLSVTGIIYLFMLSVNKDYMDHDDELSLYLR
jgi:hypothetical protein